MNSKFTRKENETRSIAEYKRGAEVLEAGPRVVYIETTNTCNLSCPMCPITMGIESYIGKSKLFKWELIEKAMPFLELADRCIMSGGGEPLMHPRFFDILRVVKNAGAMTIFNTNGTLLNEKAAKMLVELQADTISFSIDAANPEIYSRIRIGADLNLVSENIERLVRIKREAASDRPFLNLQMTLMRANLGEVITLIEKAAEWGIRHIVVEPLTPVFEDDINYANYVAKNRVDVDEALPIIRRAKRRASELGVIFSSHYLVMGGDEPSAQIENLKCAQPWINFGIRADGRIFPCCGTSETMGDLSISDPLEIWNNEKYRSLRRDFSSGKIPGICDLCVREGRSMFFNADLVL